MEIKKVLLIEDEKFIQVFMRRLLSHEFNWEISTADSGIQGLKKYDETKPDLIFLDVSMPDMNGLEFIKALRLAKKDSDTPVIITTANSNRELVAQFVEYGITDYILKPVSYESLKDRIKEILKKINA